MTTTFIDSTGGIDVTAVRAEPRINTRGSSGIDAWGVYMEWDLFVPTGDDLKHTAVVRLMVVGDTLIYQVKADDTRNAKWNFYKADSAMARDSLINVIAPAYEDEKSFKIGARNNAKPIVVQLAEQDVENMKRGEPPMVRYAAKTAFEKLYGAGDATEED